MLPESGPTSRVYFSQRLRLHYVDWGNPDAPPLILLHGGRDHCRNWDWVAAELRADYHIIAPDLRGHGDSAKPQQAADYPPDILADDGFALIEHLGLTSYALGGYSLGGRTTIRMLARGAAPSRAVVAGMGLDGVLHASGRNDHFRRILTQLGTFERRSAEGKAEAFLKSTGADPVAMLQLLDSAVDTPPEALAMIGMPVLVVAGTEDDDNGSAEALAAALPHGQAVRVPGNHMSAVARPELGVAIADFLDERAEEDAR